MSENLVKRSTFYVKDVGSGLHGWNQKCLQKCIVHFSSTRSQKQRWAMCLSGTCNNHAPTGAQGNESTQANFNATLEFLRNKKRCLRIIETQSFSRWSAGDFLLSYYLGEKSTPCIGTVLLVTEENHAYILSCQHMKRHNVVENVVTVPHGWHRFPVVGGKRGLADLHYVEKS